MGSRPLDAQPTSSQKPSLLSEAHLCQALPFWLSTWVSFTAMFSLTPHSDPIKTCLMNPTLQLRKLRPSNAKLLLKVTQPRVR